MSSGGRQLPEIMMILTRLHQLPAIFKNAVVVTTLGPLFPNGCLFGLPSGCHKKTLNSFTESGSMHESRHPHAGHPLERQGSGGSERGSTSQLPATERNYSGSSHRFGELHQTFGQ